MFLFTVYEYEYIRMNLNLINRRANKAFLLIFLRQFRTGRAVGNDVFCLLFARCDVCSTGVIAVSTHMKNVWTSGAHRAATSPVPAAMMMGTVSVFVAGQDLLSVVHHIAQTVVRIQDASTLGLQVVHGHP